VAAWKLLGRTTTLEKKARRPARRRGPAVRERPLGQLADGDEGDRKLLVGEMVRVACLLQT
jgi:hypothetical protein